MSLIDIARAIFVSASLIIFAASGPAALAQDASEVKVAPSPPAPAASRTPLIELYTMGPGDHVFSYFGHSALCVTDAVHPKGVCYNYGTTDFSNPVELVWDFLHGNVTFWVGRDDLRRMLKVYQAYDRTVYRQRLPLSREAAVAMARRLATDALPENREYLYHHFFDNCATRLRDHIDVITGGGFAATTKESYGLSIREMVQHWTTGIYSILFLSETILARTVDPPATVWQAMFLPDVLREQVAERFGVEPEILYERKGPLPAGNPDAGGWLLVILGAMGGALAFVSVRSPSRLRQRAGLVLASLPILFIALMDTFLVLISDVPELYLNEHVLVFILTDLVLWVGRPPLLKVYARYRLILLGLVALLAVVGALKQPMLAQITMVALTMLGVMLGSSDPASVAASEANALQAEAA